MMSILNINLWFQIWNICNEITPKIANNFNVSIYFFSFHTSESIIISKNSTKLVSLSEYFKKLIFIMVE